MIKNIAILVPNLHSGGSERIAARLSKALESRYKVYVILFDSGGISYDYGGELVDMNLPSVSGKAGKLVNMAKRIMHLRRFIKKNKIDVVCSFTSAADYVNAFCGAKAKRLVSCRGADFLEKNMGKYKKMCSSSNGILFNSEGMRDMYLEKYPEDKSKAFVLYNLFDIGSIKEKMLEEPESQVKEFLEKHKTVTTVARFVPEKGHWQLIKAFEILKKQVPDAGLLFVGHMGSLESKIKEMAEQSRFAKDIMFAGYSSNPFKYVARSGVYALSSLSEGFPNSLVEAMAVGVPVVSTDCLTGPREILFESNPGKIKDFVVADYGIITEPFNKIQDFNCNNKDEIHEIYAKALEVALCREEIKQIAEKAQKKAAEYDAEVIIEKYENLLNNL